MKNKFSIIVPNYNHSKFLKERLDSILHQTFQDFELIILDDKSIDNSKEIIESYRHNPKVSQIIYNEQNGGNTFKQWQRGLELARGEWVWIAESDDVAHPMFLETCSSQISDKNSIIFCRSKIIDENGKPAIYLGKEYFPNPSFLNESKLLSKHPDKITFLTREMYNFNQIVNASSVIFKKSATPDLKYIIETFKLCGDWMFWIKLIEKGELIYIDQELNYFRCHTGTVRNNSEKQLFAYFENAEITNYIFSKHGNLPLKRKYADYLIYIYFNRYPNEVRKGSFIKFLRSIKQYGFKAILFSIKKKLSNA